MDDCVSTQGLEFSTLLNPQNEIIKYINQKLWVNDVDKVQLRTIQLALIQCVEELKKYQLIQIMDSNIEKVTTYLHKSLKKVRNLNHSLQLKISDTMDSRTQSQVSRRVTESQDKLQYQIYRLHKETQISIQILQELHAQIPYILSHVDKLIDDQEGSSKYQLYKLFDMFIFELKCLKNEIIQNSSHMPMDHQLMVDIMEIEKDLIIIWLIKTIEHEVKLKSQFTQFNQILLKMLDQDFSLQSLQKVQIIQDDVSDNGSKDTQIAFSEIIISLNSQMTPQKQYDLSNKSTPYNKSAPSDQKQQGIIITKMKDFLQPQLSLPLLYEKQSISGHYVTNEKQINILKQVRDKNKLGEPERSSTCIKCSIF